MGNTILGGFGMNEKDNLTKVDTLNVIYASLSSFNSLPKEKRREILSRNITIDYNVNQKMELNFEKFTIEENIINKYNTLSENSKLELLAIILDKLGYSQIEKGVDLYKNMKILSSIIPNLNIDKIINIYSKDVIEQINFLSFIENTIDSMKQEKFQKRLCEKK